MTKPKNKSTTQIIPTSVAWARYIARLTILLITLFIFIWWPVDSYTPTGFDGWSARMSALPAQVWYILLSVILSWATTEAMASRAIKATAEPSIGNGNNFIGNDFGGFVNNESPSDGRFANLDDDDDALIGPAAPNNVVEEWLNENQ